MPMSSDLDFCNRWDAPVLPWAQDLLQGAIRAVIGRKAEITAFRALGGRSLRIDIRVSGVPQQVVALRQRQEDIRMCLPLGEEHALLRFLAQETPALAIHPLGFWPGAPGATEPLLFVEWSDGQRLGEFIDPAQRPEEVLGLLTPALKALHLIGAHRNRPALARRIGTDLMLQWAETGQPPQADIANSTWVRALERVRCALQAVSPPTMLHGDGHAYNLLVAAGGQRWIDFECAVEGPPEMDFAWTWIMLHAQATRPLSGLIRSPPQLACDILAASDFVRQPPTHVNRAAVIRVQDLLRTTVRNLLTTAG
jgi:aminoglycoside phosphotransferase (APT) family kinase protein